MFDLKNNSVRMFDTTIPKVEFESTNIMFELSEIFNTDKNMYYYMGLVLLRLGFKTEDKLFLCNYNKDDCSFDCVVNEDDLYKIRIDKELKEIVVKTLNNEFGYLCEEQSFSEIGMRISLCRYNISYLDKINFTRYLSRKDMKFRVESSDYVLELELEKTKDLELPLFENGVYAKYKLENEYELISYILGLNFNEDICDIYKKMCELYIGDVNKYPKFMLRKSKKVNGNFKVTDMILLKNGELEQFCITSYDRTFFIDKDDNWSYEMPIEGALPVSFLMTYCDGKKTCVFSSEEDDCLMDYINGNIMKDIEISTNEISYTRRRILEVFGNNRGSN